MTFSIQHSSLGESRVWHMAQLLPVCNSPGLHPLSTSWAGADEALLTSSFAAVGLFSLLPLDSRLDTESLT